MTFHPHYDGDGNQIALIGNDGGIFRTSNARAATKRAARRMHRRRADQVAWTSLNHGYGVTQFYHGTAFPDGARYLAGAQDNGTLFGSDAVGPDGVAAGLRRRRRIQRRASSAASTWLMEFQWASLGRTTTAALTISSGDERPRSDRREQLGPEANYLFVTPFTHDPDRRRDLAGRRISCIAGRQFGLTWRKSAPRCRTGGRISALAVSAGAQRALW